MDHDRWRRVEEAFQQALEASGPARVAVLDRFCRDEDELRREVEYLHLAVQADTQVSDK